MLHFVPVPPRLKGTLARSLGGAGTAIYYSYVTCTRVQGSEGCTRVHEKLPAGNEGKRHGIGCRVPAARYRPPTGNVPSPRRIGLALTPLIESK